MGDGSEGDQRIVPELFLTSSAGFSTDLRGRYTFTQDLNLPPIFWDQLAVVLDLVVFVDAFGSLFGEQLSNDRKVMRERQDCAPAQLAGFIEKVQRLVDETQGQQGWNAYTGAFVRLLLGLALQQQGILRGDIGPLKSAAAIFEDLLNSHEENRLFRPTLEEFLARNWVALAELQDSPELAKKAVAALRQLIEVTPKTQDPNGLTIIGLRNDLGWALSVLGMELEDTAYFEQSVDVYRAAAAGVKRTGQYPTAWAGEQTNLGDALVNLGAREFGEIGNRHLKEAVNVYRGVLEGLGPNLSPLSKKVIEADLAAAFLALGVRDSAEQGTVWLEEAMKTYKAIADQPPQGDVPNAMLSQLGVAVSTLSERKPGRAGVEDLKVAVQIYRSTLGQYPPKNPSPEWYAAQGSMGYALRNLAQLTGQPDLLCEALIRSVIAERGLAYAGAPILGESSAWYEYQGAAQEDMSLIGSAYGDSTKKACLSTTTLLLRAFRPPAPANFQTTATYFCGPT